MTFISKKPKQVTTAVNLLWIIMGLGVISSIFTFSSSLEIANVSGLGLRWLIFTLYFTYLLLAFLIWKIGQGRNWARITYLILFVIGVPFTLYNYLTSEVSLFLIISGLAGIIVQIVVLTLLFQKPSSEWFKKNK